ncbi:30S ribosomal protein S5, partial [Patescibacteria group bacterium]|nr:30S ribosomal protein S5 [Patescibacteria group bacterium]
MAEGMYQKEGFEEEIVQVSRVSKKTKGGNKIGFSVLTVVGDKNGKVGVGLGKAPDVSSAIKKGVLIAKKHAIEFPIIRESIPFEIYIKLGGAKILLKP